MSHFASNNNITKDYYADKSRLEKKEKQQLDVEKLS